MKLSVDFGKVTGSIKPMHAVGQPPYLSPDTDYLYYLTRANVPYSRLHDMGGEFADCLYADIPNIFRDFSADETLEESYDFIFTDDLICKMMKAGAQPFFRLGVTIENYKKLRSYRLDPPADPAKWARVCEHIIRHYNEGWANGYHFGIKYWEIWNEPDNDFPGKEYDNQMWSGSKEQYYELYEVTSKHLKAYFGDSIQVGGYASCGFYGMASDPDCTGIGRPAKTRNEYFIEFMHGFFSWITSEEHKSPIDFFSWHSYATVEETLVYASYLRRVMANYGLDDVPDILNEWNTCHDMICRKEPQAAAKLLSMLLAMQKTRTAMLNVYDGRMRAGAYEALFNAETRKPLPAYYSILAFGRLYALANECECVCDAERVYACAAADDKRGILLIANNSDADVTLEVDAGAAEAYEILRIDDTYTYSVTGEKLAGSIMIPANSCAEIDFIR